MRVSTAEFLAEYPDVPSTLSTVGQTQRAKIMRRYKWILKQPNFGFEEYNIPVATMANPSLLVYLFEERQREWGDPVSWEDDGPSDDISVDVKVERESSTRPSSSRRQRSASVDSTCSKWSTTGWKTVEDRSQGEGPYNPYSDRFLSRPMGKHDDPAAAEEEREILDLATRVSEKGMPEFDELQLDAATKEAILQAQAATIEALSYGDGGLKNSNAVIAAQKATIEALLTNAKEFRSYRRAMLNENYALCRHSYPDRYRPRGYRKSSHLSTNASRNSSVSRSILFDGRKLYPDRYTPGYQLLLAPRSYRGLSPSSSRCLSRTTSHAGTSDSDSDTDYQAGRGRSPVRFTKFGQQLADRTSIPRGHAFGPAAFEPKYRITNYGSVCKPSHSRSRTMGQRLQHEDITPRRERSYSVDDARSAHTPTYRSTGYYNNADCDISGSNSPENVPIECDDLRSFGPVEPYRSPATRASSRATSVSAHVRESATYKDLNLGPFEKAYYELYEERYGREPSIETFLGRDSPASLSAESPKRSAYDYEEGEVPDGAYRSNSVTERGYSSPPRTEYWCTTSDRRPRSPSASTAYGLDSRQATYDLYRKNALARR